MSEQPISPLRRRMIKNMTVRNFLEKTRNDYIRQARTFTRSPERPSLRIFAASSCIRCQTLVSLTLAPSEVPIVLGRCFFPESWTSDRARYLMPSGDQQPVYMQAYSPER